MSSAPLPATRSNPSCRRSPAPAPLPVCRPTSPRHVSACAAPCSALVVLLLYLSNLDSDDAGGLASNYYSDPLFSILIHYLVLCEAGQAVKAAKADSLPGIMPMIGATLIHSCRRSLARASISLHIVNQTKPNMTGIICAGCCQTERWRT